MKLASDQIIPSLISSTLKAAQIKALRATNAKGRNAGLHQIFPRLSKELGKMVRFPDDPKRAPQNDGEKPEKERLEPRSSEFLNAFSISSDGLTHECVEDAPLAPEIPRYRRL